VNAPRTASVLLGTLSIACLGPASATELTALDRGRISVGTFSNQLNLHGRVDGRVSIDSNTFVEGSTRDFADDFDIGNRRSISLWELGWRPFERHEFSLRRYSDARRKTARITDELRFDGQVFAFDVELEGRAAFEALELSYTGWLHADQRSAVGLQLGVLRLAGSVAIAGEIESPDFGRARGEAEVSNQLHAPLLGISGRRVFGRHVRGFVELRAIKLDYSGIDGKALSASAGVEVYPWRKLGLVLQYSDTWVRAERRSDNFSGRLEVGFSGPQALLRWRM